MNVEDTEITEWRGLIAQDSSLAPHRERIEAVYWQVCGKKLRKCNCKDILKDAVMEIYTKLKMQNMGKNTNGTTARLVAGVVLFWGGSHYTNINLTDEVARQWLQKFPHRTDWFEVLPPKAEEKTAENGPEIAPAEVKSESKPTAQKKKKASKKRK